jgi:hypothetical protein
MFCIFSSGKKLIYRDYPYLCKNGNNRLSKLKIKNEKNPWSRQGVGRHHRCSRPALKDGGKVDLSKYDVVYVGFPIWWYTAPTIINTFIEANDFTGKTIVPFATSGGSSIKQACKDLQAAYPKYKFGEGKLLNKIEKAEIEKWADAVK